MSIRLESPVGLAVGERPYSDETVTVIGEWMILIAQPTRLRLLDRLELAGELHEQALVDELSTTQQNVSRHLRLLLLAGVVARRQEGRVAWYRLTDPDLLYPVHWLAGEAFLSQSYRSGSELVHIGGAPAVGFGFL